MRAAFFVLTTTRQLPFARTCSSTSCPQGVFRSEFRLVKMNHSNLTHSNSAQADPLDGSHRPDVSVIILNWNTRDMLADCLDTLAQQSGNLSLEIIVVDNASSDGSRELLPKEFPLVRLIVNTANLGFPAANNQGASMAAGRFLLFLNPD